MLFSSANVAANLVSMNLDGNVNVWFPGTSYLDVSRFEFLKKFRSQFDSNGTMYYIDADSGFVTTADVSATTKENPYVEIRSINSYVCGTAFRCIFNVDEDILTFFNPDTRFITALNRGNIAYNSVYASNTNFGFSYNYDSTLSISHTLNQNGFVVIVFTGSNSSWNYYNVTYSIAQAYCYYCGIAYNYNYYRYLF